uniref:Uncharacterized protein n=1 Tax=Glossina austeni TaxID=7395 RepID=A0A1A9UEU8_GLOAU
MLKHFEKDLHDVLSRLLREYPVLWRRWAGPTNGKYKELTRRLSEQLLISRQREQTFQESVRLTAEDFLGFEQGVLDKKIPITDETILAVMDSIREGKTVTAETDAPRVPEPIEANDVSLSTVHSRG